MENNYIKTNDYGSLDNTIDYGTLDKILESYKTDKTQYSQYDSIINVVDYTSAALKTKEMTDFLDEEKLLTLKEQVKLLEKKIKEKNKPKTITISGETHNKIKNFCNSINMNIGDWVSKTVIDAIDDYINKYDCIIKDNEIDDIKVLKEKYSNVIINEDGKTVYTKEAYDIIHNQGVFKSLNVKFEEEDDIIVDKLIPKDVIIAEDIQIKTTDGFPGFDFKCNNFSKENE